MNNTTQLHLLRHGETEAGQVFCGSTDVPLNQKGWKQMRQSVADQIIDWNCIITSPLKRCAEFATELSAQRSIPLYYDERLKEMHFGTWEGFSASEIMRNNADQLTRFWRDPVRYTPPEAEALTAFKARVMSAWSDLIERYQDDRILLVTHAGVIKVLFCHILQRPIHQLLEFEVEHAVLRHVQIEHTSGSQRCILYETQHLT